MSAHDFNISLKKEQESANYADRFYLSEGFKAKIVERFNQHTQAHLSIQKQDIDVKLLLANGKEVSVSEKFREKDYNDLLIEIHSKYPKVPGWMHKSEADRLAYFFPTRMFWLDKKALGSFCLKTLFPKIEENAIEQLITQESNSLKVSIDLNGIKYPCTLTQAMNKTKDSCWDTVSISIPFNMLNDFEIRYQVFTF